MRSRAALSPAVSINPGGPLLGVSHALLRGEARTYHVGDFPGPLSIKWVARGSALWETGESRYAVDERSFVILNDGRRYSISIDSPEPVETFCVFFRRGFVEEAMRAVSSPVERILDEGPDVRPAAAGFFETLRRSDARIVPILQRMRDRLARGRASDLWLDDRFHDLAGGLLAVQGDTRRAIARVPAVRAATREELFRRVHRGKEFIEASLAEPLTLATVARAACLSSYHFHRLFTRIFRETPHRYIVRRRLERAQDLLARTDRPVTRICLDTGFESLGSFSWLFRRRVGASPSRFRADRRRISRI